MASPRSLAAAISRPRSGAFANEQEQEVRLNTEERRRFKDRLQALGRTHVPGVGDHECPVEPVLSPERIGFREGKHVVDIDEVRDQANLVGGHPFLEDSATHPGRDDGDGRGARIDETLEREEEANHPAVPQRAQGDRDIGIQLLDVVHEWRAVDESEQPGADANGQRRRRRDDDVDAPDQREGRNQAAARWNCVHASSVERTFPLLRGMPTCRTRMPWNSLR